MHLLLGNDTAAVAAAARPSVRCSSSSSSASSSSIASIAACMQTTVVRVAYAHCAGTCTGSCRARYRPGAARIPIPHSSGYPRPPAPSNHHQQPCTAVLHLPFPRVYAAPKSVVLANSIHMAQLAQPLIHAVRLAVAHLWTTPPPLVRRARGSHGGRAAGGRSRGEW